jgi:hypothetical protein
MSEPLMAIKCPSMRYRVGRGMQLCNGLVIIGEHYGHCPKCGIFYDVDHEEEGVVTVRKIEKQKINFKWLIFRFEKNVDLAV